MSLPLYKFSDIRPDKDLRKIYQKCYQIHKFTRNLSCTSNNSKQTSNFDKDDRFYEINPTRGNWNEIYLRNF